ncbi:geranylgeranylglyceryl phosphate synthase [Nonlabens ulvanivorans]|uniref:Geranylgeranylglyceryl phosphate synthase n=2 Tax=Nonlabens ulvanivorans TaxID=906888 RepID=A0A084JUG9_NONUL|nr:geranylgeranylglyceryl phosphate synthase [Nonlabens ulvanivorans]PRX15443.1 putative glycerol-1-phosphate prenyltransferase [Nonlabens ulvanivorans]
MHNVLRTIKESQRTMAFLLDPEKTRIEDLIETFDHINNLRILIQTELSVEYFVLFVGGSTMINVDLDKWILAAKEIIKIPIVIFPGSHHQLTENADGLLFLNLISGDNPDYLIRQQRQAAAQLLRSQLEIVPTGYLLIDGGHESAVQRVSQTLPLSQHDADSIIHTAFAGQLMGNQLIYLEAGSGAITPVNPEIIKSVKNQLEIPLIVGGGLRSLQQLKSSYLAGADMLVIGTAIEQKINWN